MRTKTWIAGLVVAIAALGGAGFAQAQDVHSTPRHSYDRHGRPSVDLDLHRGFYLESHGRGFDLHYGTYAERHYRDYATPHRTTVERHHVPVYSPKAKHHDSRARGYGSVHQPPVRHEARQGHHR